VVKRGELTDQAWDHAPLAREWATRQAVAEPPRGRGRDPLCKLRTGSSWRDLSGRYDPHKKRADERTRTADLLI
jgi:hypothetical protein